MSVPGCFKPFSRLSDIRSATIVRGFTLVELLVVIVILSLITGLIILNLARDERRELEREARHLVGALAYASDRARYRHELLGIAALPDGGGWQFLLFPEQTSSWHVIDNDPLLQTKTFPQPLRFRLIGYAGKDIRENAVIPIPPSGRHEPYSLELRNGAWRVNLIADPLGRIAATQPEMISP